MTPWQETAALRDFKPAYDRYGSFATDEVEGARPRMSAVPRGHRFSSFPPPTLGERVIAASRVMVCLSIRRSLPSTCENDFNRPILLLWPKGSLIIGVENEGAPRIDGNRFDDALVVLARNDAGLATLSIDKTNDSARRSSRTGRSCGAGLACLSLRPVGCTGGIG